MRRTPPLTRLLDALRRGALPAVLLLAFAGLGALGIVAWGIVPIGAAGGHMFPLGTLLPFAKERAVAHHAGSVPAQEVPLDLPSAVHRGAAHYEAMCAGCHGSAARGAAAFTEGMLPEPPALASTLPSAAPSPAEEYWTVEHGIKFTGMPAWPGEVRSDEIWAVVSFLEAQRSMEADAYRRLAGTDPGPRPADAPAGTRRCAGCHGWRGMGFADGAFPNLTLQDSAYLDLALRGYVEGRRHSGMMRLQVEDLDESTLARLAGWYGAQEPRRPAPAPDAPSLAETPGLVGGGGRRSAAGDSDELVGCVSCHGIARGATHGGPPPQDRTRYPHLSGQYEAYLANQLRAFVRGERGTSLDPSPEERGAHALTPEEIGTVAAWYAARTPETKHSMLPDSLQSAQGPPTG